ncbi:Uncharacterised protein [Leclercia adecarboxylata]|nr:Uncharacterised protein [Leclercia adecarboxylata]
MQGGVGRHHKLAAASARGRGQQGGVPGRVTHRIIPIGRHRVGRIHAQRIADVVDRIQRHRRWGDVQRGGVLIAIRCRHGIDEGVRRADQVGPHPGPQGIGVFALRVDQQGAVLPLNAGGARGVHVNAVHLGDEGACWHNVTLQHVAGRRGGGAGDGINMIFQDVDLVAGQGGDP